MICQLVPLVDMFQCIVSAQKKSIDLNTSISNYDLVILATDHDQYDYEYLQKKAQLIIDTRGRFKGNYSNIISA